MEEKLGGFLKEYEIVKEAYTFFDHVKEDFSIAKEYLVPYVFDAEIRATLLENHPYRRIGDIALECHLLYVEVDQVVPDDCSALRLRDKYLITRR